MNMVEGKPLPVYGQGLNVRDWLYVTDHAEAIWTIVANAPAGETYNVGGENEWKNIDLVKHLCEVVAEQTGSPASEYLGLIKYVTDRPGHDHRYAIDCTKIKRELGWTQAHDFPSGLRETVAWYLDNPGWIESVRSGEYRKWMETNYGAMNRA